jgi:hypothetical protein
VSEATGSGAVATDAATPLWQRLGIRPGCTLALVGTPDGFEIPDLPGGVRVLERASEPLDVAVFFTSREQTLRGRMALLEPWLAPAGGLWIAWPKPASGRETDLSADIVHNIGLEHGLLDGGAASIDETWTARRLVRRHGDR